MYALSSMRTRPNQLQFLNRTAVVCVVDELVMCPQEMHVSCASTCVQGAWHASRPHASGPSSQGRLSQSTDRPGQTPSRHWGPSAAEVGDHRTRSAPGQEGEQEEDSLDAFVVETHLVPVSLSQIPDQLPDHVS